jgi:hypothetical protein
MKSNWREERTIFRSIRCARIHGLVMNGWDGGHSATCIQDLSPSIQHDLSSPAESMATSAAPGELRFIQPTINLGRKLTIVMAARAITHKIDHDR